MQFLPAFIDTIPLDTGMRVGSVQFATSASMVGDFTSDDITAKGYLQSVNKTAEGGKTHTHLGVDRAMDMFANSTQRNPGGADVLLVITDGEPGGGMLAGSPGDVAFAKAIDRGVKVHFVFVGWYFGSLFTIPSAWYTSGVKINDFGELNALKDSLADRVTCVCGDATTTTTTSTATAPVCTLDL